MKQKAFGFTLLEVLLALSVMAIALTALLTATSQSIKNTEGLEHKIIGHIVTTQASTMLELKLVPLERHQEVTDTMTLLGRSWTWHAKAVPTDQTGIEQLEISATLKGTKVPQDSFIGYRNTP